MNEHEPIHFANLNLPDGERLEITTDNIRLYRHIGKYAVYDHLFVTAGEEQGIFIWAQQPPDNTNYSNLAPLAVENGIEMHLNIRQPSVGDIETFERHSFQGLEEIPDWLPEL